ncbi:N-acetylmuramidase domain-containing protein [Gallaecimonas xiamenensis]|uniref:Uncharacterized protein n=1 Tax=Gallaecimonas xiamenensis 3-C-1 TaxID=745411 RepID=K2JSF3_9GAMM|nr:N-acetylmuramidase domain-containing protein [Gallaecimonas xiamenensis]EKE77437.1 hypothetical protein B3C1_01460 [Gallaecimonas xiamenensis 3-C-1]
MTKSIIAAVGRGGTNRRDDVLTVQTLLNRQKTPTFSVQLKEDGMMGPKTLAAIEQFQRTVVHLPRPDGRVDRNGKTLAALNRQASTPTNPSATQLPAISPQTPLTEADFAEAAKALGVEVAAVKAVAQVESQGDAFLASGKPKILFEAHKFSRFTQHRYDGSHPSISSRHWSRALYKGGEKEYDRLKDAMALDREAALKSASWGRFQIMGFNYQLAGFNSVEEMVKAMFASEAKQLAAFLAFIESAGLGKYLKTKDWAKFAEGYNGSGYKANHYDTKLKDAYQNSL